MTQCWEEVLDIIGTRRVELGPQASDQYLNAPEHLAMVLSRYRAAAALIGDARRVLEAGCGEGIGAGILARGRDRYCGVDNDSGAVAIARSIYGRTGPSFAELDILANPWLPGTGYDAVVSMDVIEHIPAEHEAAFMKALTDPLFGYGVAAIGTPSANAAHLASPQSQAGHVNLYTPERLRDLMARHFNIVQMLYMQDTAIHLGHPGMAHYILAVGIGPRTGES